MSRRTERVSSMIRNTLGQLLLSKLADPRVDPARTSITHVEIFEDMLSATVYISVIGSEADSRKAVSALNGAAGHFQEMLGKRIYLRNTPHLKFELDVKFKKTLQTLELIQEAMDEIHEKEAQNEDDNNDQLTINNDNEQRQRPCL